MSLTYLTEGIVTPFALIPGGGEDYRDIAVRAFSNGLFGLSTWGDATTQSIFVWLEPINAADRRSGGICCVTGYWCAGRGMVTTSRGRAIREFAPNDKPGRDK